MKPPQIIGIVLIRNEDINIQWVLTNLLGFCDRIMVLDNYSTDNTYQAVADLAKINPKIELTRRHNAKTSQKVLRKYYATDTYILHVDGDEVCDPNGLAKLRPRIIGGEFNAVYYLGGCAINCTAVDTINKTATGYTSGGGINIYNFNVVRGWENENRERLHGHPIFNDKIEHKTIDLGGFDKSILRCLHLCFMPRSSGLVKHRFGLIGWKRRRKQRIKPNPSGNPHHARPGPGNTVEYKMKHYASGEQTTVCIADFINHSLEKSK